jgi:hypothetical protein
MIKQNIKKAWNWLWYSDSLLSWIVSLIIAFILVKFVFFPFLSLVLGTPLPLVVVESESMEHPQAGFIGNVIGLEDSFELWWQSQGDWYENKNIDKSQASEWPLKTGFDKGDIMLVWGRGDKEVGDVIIFNANTKHPIIHRIVDIDKKRGVIETKGDNNIAQLHDEKSITENAVIGEAVFRIPKLGWIKLVFVEIINAFTK